MRFLPALILTLALAVPAGAAPLAGNEILAALQSRLETGGEVEDLVDQLDDLGLDELKQLHLDFERAWLRVREAYLAAFESEAKVQNSGEAKQANAKRVDTLRNDFHRVRSMSEGPMKEALKKVSAPAMKALRELLLPTPAQIVAAAGEPLRKQRQAARTLAAFRDGLLTAMVSIEESNSVALLEAAETATAEDYSGLAREGIRIMRANRAAAVKDEVPEAERLGVEELNTMRLLAGLPALALDARLCDASRGHSQDMHEHKFFAHTSPLDGKTTPADRARLAGTTGGGENIYVGSDSPKAANKGWFFSPGHHKNMFHRGYRRVGMGNHGKHWTQMFGGRSG
ncbi:MAG: hypothetical protein HKN82_04215 [Akkermansiaceae bacterium]|nr:hypothetical protein [Akkermansiaceae bacterium]